MGDLNRSPIPQSWLPKVVGGVVEVFARRLTEPLSSDDNFVFLIVLLLSVFSVRCFRLVPELDFDFSVCNET